MGMITRTGGDAHDAGVQTIGMMLFMILASVGLDYHMKEGQQPISFLTAASTVGSVFYSRAMRSEAGKAHHYAVARAFLDQADWEKSVWIEEHGTLDGFPV